MANALLPADAVDVAGEDGVVVLRGGFSVYLPALQVAWHLEEKGCVLLLDGNDLIVRPKHLLTAADRQAIRQWLEELKRIAKYDGDEGSVV